MAAIDAAFRAVVATLQAERSNILQHAGHVTFTSKADGSPVTDIDVAVEEHIRQTLQKSLPQIPVFGEEGGYSGVMPELFWLVDPIDGTKSFIANIPAFTSMISLVHGETTIACMIYNISTDTLYHAQRGHGAYKGSERLDLSALPLPTLALCKIKLSRQITELLKPFNITCETGPSGGGHGFTMVAEGLSAARFTLLGGGYAHDYAPGGLLVSEAGGSIIPIRNNTYTYETKSFVACHPQLTPIVTENISYLRQLEHDLAG